MVTRCSSCSSLVCTGSCDSEGGKKKTGSWKAGGYHIAPAYVTCVESGELIQRRAATACRISISSRTTSFNISCAPLACHLPSWSIVGISTRHLLEPPPPVQSLCLRQVALPALRREAAAWDLAQMQVICPCRRNNQCLERQYTLLLRLVRLLRRAVPCRNRT